jgi:demethylmenaquinone methyltransferase/2-methoxy-6-polyprenyl-1,4-benzoquinol methylase
MAYRLPEPEQKARYVRGKFDEIARSYDLFNDLITQGQHRIWKNVLVKRLGLCSGAQGLDLCCGTGDIALRTWRRLKGGGNVFALDFSINMLRIARGRLAGKGLPTAAARGLLCGDAMRLPFANASLKFVTVGFGLRNVAQLEGCLKEVHRVLMPGGVLASLDVGKVGSPLLRPLAEFYFFRIVPLIGRLLQPGQEMFNYLPESSVAYPSQQALRKLMIECGFGEVELIEFALGASVIHIAHKAGGEGVD